MSINATWHLGWILEQWKTGRIQIKSDFSLIMMYWWCSLLLINAFWWYKTNTKGSWVRSEREQLSLLQMCLMSLVANAHICRNECLRRVTERRNTSGLLLCSAYTLETLSHQTGTRPAASKPHWSSGPRSLENWSCRHLCGHAGPCHMGCWFWTQTLVLQHRVLLLSHLPGTIIL